MTVSGLKDILDEYDLEAHIVIAITAPIAGPVKLEVRECWCDSHSVVNIIMGGSVCEIDPALYSENEIEKPEAAEA